MIPACIKLLAPDPAFFAFLLFEQIESQSTQGRQIFGGISSTSAALIFAKTNIHDPMNLVLDAPVAAYRPCEGLHVHCKAG